MSGLLDAARKGDLADMQRLIKEGASVYQPDGRGMNALMHAVLNDHAPMVHWLLKERGAQISDIKRD